MDWAVAQKSAQVPQSFQSTLVVVMAGSSSSGEAGDGASLCSVLLPLPLPLSLSLPCLEVVEGGVTTAGCVAPTTVVVWVQSGEETYGGNAVPGPKSRAVDKSGSALGETVVALVLVLNLDFMVLTCSLGLAKELLHESSHVSSGDTTSPLSNVVGLGVVLAA